MKKPTKCEALRSAARTRNLHGQIVLGYAHLGSRDPKRRGTKERGVEEGRKSMRLENGEPPNGGRQERRPVRGTIHRDFEN